MPGWALPDLPRFFSTASIRQATGKKEIGRADPGPPCIFCLRRALCILFCFRRALCTFFCLRVRSAFSFAIGGRSALSFASGGCPFIFFCPGHPVAGYSLKKAGLRGVNQILCKILSRNLKTGRQNEGKKTKGGFLLKKYIGNRHRGVL